MHKRIFKDLENFDTPTIANVVATYPEKDYCLGLYNPWSTKWYTDQSLKCIYPEIGRRVGVAVTCTYGLPDLSYNKLNFSDLLKTISKIESPVVLVVKQNFPDEIKNKNGLLGGNMMTALKSVGVVGVISDGPSRDIDEIRPLNMQYMLTGVCAGHGKFSLESINMPVEVCGMMVAPGDIIHMDENGAVKFPEDFMEEIVQKSYQIQAIESNRQKLMRNTNDVDKIIKIMKGLYD